MEDHPVQRHEGQVGDEISRRETGTYRRERGSMLTGKRARMVATSGLPVIAQEGFPRPAEVILAAVSILLCLPLLLGVALAVKFQDGGPTLYRARRVGRGGKEFLLLKFRSMVVNADSVGGGLTTRTDDRITPVGRVLRQYKLDEFPQLFNVLFGEMSFVGPRAEDPRYVALYTPEQRGVLTVRPGITSPASLAYRNESVLLTGDDWEQAYLSRILPRKLSLDLEYLRTRNAATDLHLVVKTVLSMFR
jgi:lipopolysaccharide/colanic/teichoic acid biosynthesis glycosyltransferase